ncbi:hypothetical protein AtEden1_Chr4g0280121 [Arabidopsis thaliana]
MVQDYTLAEGNSLSFLDTITEDKEDTFQITDPSQQSNEEVSQEEVMVNEETKEVDKMEEETQTNGEDNGTEVINPEIANVELPAKKRVVKNKAGLPGVNSRKRNLTSPWKRAVSKPGGPTVGTSSLYGERDPPKD